MKPFHYLLIVILISAVLIGISISDNAQIQVKLTDKIGAVVEEVVAEVEEKRQLLVDTCGIDHVWNSTWCVFPIPNSPGHFVICKPRSMKNGRLFCYDNEDTKIVIEIPKL